MARLRLGPMIRSGNGFSLRRLGLSLWTDSTRTLEVVIGLMFFVVRGIRFGAPGGSGFLAPLGLHEGCLGTCLVVGGLLHLWAAGTDWPLVRAAVAAGGVALCLTVVSVLFMAGLATHELSISWLAVVVIECYIMLRNFSHPVRP